jgi:predicted metalloprotease with PDZ domain
VDDEILAIGDFRVRATQLTNRLNQYQAGSTVSVLVARREELRRFDLTLVAQPPQTGALDVDPDASIEAGRHRTAWLSGD